MPVAQAAGQLLLLQVHHAHDAGQFGGFVAVVKQRVLRLHPYLGEHDPADAIHLRQRHNAAHHEREHVPQSALQFFGFDVFAHLVLADHAVRFDGVAEFGFVKLRTGDVGQHHAVTPRKGQLALVWAFGGRQLRVTLQRIDYLVCVLPGLLQWIWNGLGAEVAMDDPGLFVGLDEGGEPEVLDLQDQDASARVHDDEIRVQVLGPYSHVVPQQVVVVELLFQPLGCAALAGCHARDAAANGGDECCHDAFCCCRTVARLCEPFK